MNHIESLISAFRADNEGCFDGHCPKDEKVSDMEYVKGAGEICLQ